MLKKIIGAINVCTVIGASTTGYFEFQGSKDSIFGDRNVGYKNGNTGNIGAYQGLDSTSTSGNNNIGAFNGNGNTGEYNGNNNVGAYNGNYNGGSYNGNNNIGGGNGNYNGVSS